MHKMEFPLYIILVDYVILIMAFAFYKAHSKPNICLLPVTDPFRNGRFVYSCIQFEMRWVEEYTANES